MTQTFKDLALPAAGRALRMTTKLPVIDRWQLLQPLGEGAMADVYLAAPGENASPAAARYALKVLKRCWEDDPVAVSLFAREAHLGQSISDPHLVPVLDWNLKSAPYYVAMPHLEGTTLEAQLRQNREVDLPVALWIVRQVAQGLDALHAAGWMHADVKPANIFISPGGHVTLIDLGYARGAHETGSVAERPLAGTLNYLAPEMLTSALSADIRSDIYSLGIVLYELLAGQLPYEGRNPVEVAALQRAGVPDRLRCLAPQLPPSAVTLVRQMMAKEPLRRPQTPSELVRRLTRLEIATFRERLPA